MDGQGLRMCRFTRDGIPELGEYLESVDGTGICKLTELDGGGEEVVVCLPDGTMPEGISDLELVRVPTRIEEGDAKTETMSDETAERMARTRFIVDEYTMGVLDEQEAGERLFRNPRAGCPSNGCRGCCGSIPLWPPSRCAGSVLYGRGPVSVSACGSFAGCSTLPRR